MCLPPVKKDRSRRDAGQVRFGLPRYAKQNAGLPASDGRFTVIRRGRAPLLALVAMLGYSRASFVHLTAGEDASTLCECLREAFVYFDGMPEQVEFDNAKSVVIEHKFANYPILEESQGASKNRFCAAWCADHGFVFNRVFTTNSTPGRGLTACRKRFRT
jgi:transposase